MKIYVDITGFINVKFMTGIQRVVREITFRLLEKNDIDLKLLYCPNKLLNEFYLIDNIKYKNIIDSLNKKSCVTFRSIRCEDIEENSIFYEVDGVWIHSISRSYLYPILKKNNVKIVTHLHDIIALNNPSYGFQNTIFLYMNFVASQFEYADAILTCSQNNIDDFKKFSKTLKKEFEQYYVMPCGSDFYNDKKKKFCVSSEAKNIVKKGKYILMVSTIEPRKNQKFLLDAYDQGLKELGVNIVLVGREGWNVKELISRIYKHEKYNDGIYYLSNANDDTVKYLYKNSFLVAFTSFNEGFGLPIVESLQYGNVTLASNIPVLKEVGGNYCDYFNLDNTEEFINIVFNYLSNSMLYEERKRYIKSYIPYTWDNAVEILCEIFNKYICVEEYNKNKEVKQEINLISFQQDLRKRYRQKIVLDIFEKLYRIENKVNPSFLFIISRENIELILPRKYMVSVYDNPKIEIKIFNYDNWKNNIELKCFFSTDKNRTLLLLDSVTFVTEESSIQISLHNIPYSSQKGELVFCYEIRNKEYHIKTLPLEIIYKL